jgi:aminoglycoside phosphotransferase (APT) family kinase protein
VARAPEKLSEDIERQLVDPQKLSAFLDDKLAGSGQFEASRHIAGHSCETFIVGRSGSEWVLRRPPLAVYLPTAHDVLREYRVLSALAPTNVRSPKPALVCEDESVIGAPFYLMEKVEGAVIRTEVPAALDNMSDRRRIGFELVEALAELHSVDYKKAGLEGFGKPAGYLERQVRRWTGQLELATSITKQSREVPEMWEVREWLAAHLPQSPPSVIVHGDYKLDNVSYAPTSPARLAAIFDWEMSTIGDPLADLGWMLSYWRQKDDPQDPLHSALNQVTAAEGFAPRRELIDHYESLTGRKAGDLRWYIVAAIWKLACLLEGSYGRHLMGTTDDPFFAQLEWGIPALAASALSISKGELKF